MHRGKLQRAEGVQPVRTARGARRGESPDSSGHGPDPTAATRRFPDVRPNLTSPLPSSCSNVAPRKLGPRALSTFLAVQARSLEMDAGCLLMASYRLSLICKKP